MSCAETAEPIDLPFGLCTRVGRRKHEFNRMRQMASMCTISIVFVRWRQRTRRQSAVSCAKGLNRSICRFVDSGGPKEAQVQSSSMGLHGWTHWCHLANTIEPSVCGGDAALCQITLSTC